MKHHLVNSPRNSVCPSSRLDVLDWQDWWTDNSNGWNYLHVHRKMDDTYHRVYCKATDTPRLKMVRGELYWLVEK